MKVECLNIRPIPDGRGVGFMSLEPVSDDMALGYRLEQVGRYYNYHFTKACWQWPVHTVPPEEVTIDAFSPNLNKQLHIGHLRNLALAVFYDRFLPSKMVSILGASLGIQDGAEEALEEWFQFLQFIPMKYRDTALAKLKDGIIQSLDVTIPTDGEYAGCVVWEGRRGPTVLVRSDGRETYSLHDLCFAKQAAPDFYLTGSEQKEHFENLGFGDKHLPMGLVLDPKTGKKMKSRDGTALAASEAVQMAIDALKETPEPKKLAWNVLAWNFLHVSRSQNVKFDVENWTKPDSAGMYISYTLARLRSALEGVDSGNDHELTDSDIETLGYIGYWDFYSDQSANKMDSAPLANYAHSLARRLGNLYHVEKIKGGRPGFQFVMSQGYEALKETTEQLGMFPLEKV